MYRKNIKKYTNKLIYINFLYKMMKDKHATNKRGIMFYILLFMYIYLNVVSNHIIIVYEGKKRMCGGTTIYI